MPDTESSWTELASLLTGAERFVLASLLTINWTQWAFLEMFGHWYDNGEQKAKKIELLEEIFAAEGNANVNSSMRRG